MTDYPDRIAALLTEQVRRNHEAIETMCERMLLLPGDWGVLVTHLPDGTVRVELSHDVPPLTVGHRIQSTESPTQPTMGT